MSGKKAKLLRKIAAVAFPKGKGAVEYEELQREVLIKGKKVDEEGNLVDTQHVVVLMGQRTHVPNTFKGVLNQIKKFAKEEKRV